MQVWDVGLPSVSGVHLISASGPSRVGVVEEGGRGCIYQELGCTSVPGSGQVLGRHLQN